MSAERTPETTDRGAAWAGRIVLLASVALVLWGMRQVTAGDNVYSRVATVWSLVHEGSWYIDGLANPFEPLTIDKVQVGGRLLSSKPPLLPLAMTAEYFVLHRVFGLQLDRQEDLKRALQIMTVTLIGAAYAAALFCFSLILRFGVADPWRRVFLLAALAFATQLPGFATQLNNHVPAAAALLAALYFAIGVGTGRLAPHPLRFFAFGLFAGLVFTLDIPITIFAAFAGLLMLYLFPLPALLWGGLGALGPLALQFGIMWTVTGSPLPVQMRKELYLYEAAYWRNPTGIDALNEPKLTYLFNFTFGQHGTFLLFPILLLGLAGALWAAARRGAPWRAWVLGGAAAFVILTAYYVTGTNNYGGAAYGFRWYIGAMPVLLLMGAPLVEHIRGAAGWGAAAALFAVSAGSAWECYRSPWGANLEWTSRWLFSVG